MNTLKETVVRLEPDKVNALLGTDVSEDDMRVILLKLGFGLMRLPRLEDKTIDVEQSKKMVDAFLAAGGKYFDTAFVYEGSEEATRKALCERHPRESYYLATKLNVGDSVCKSAEDAKHTRAGAHV